MIPLIVCIGYGNEHPVFPRAKNLWSFYRDYFPDTNVYFFRSSSDLRPEEVNFSNGEFTFGISDAIPHAPAGTAKYEVTGFTLDRQLKLYRQLLSMYREPFWLYTHTVTSAVDYAWLRAIVNQIECRQVFGGGMDVVMLPEGMGPDLPANKLFRFVSGAGTLLSSDLLHLVLNRSHLVHHQMPNDLWLSFVLRDIPRTPFMRCDLTDITEFTTASRVELQARITEARANGHFHFRVKSGRWESEGQLFHDPSKIDPLVINTAMLEILAKSVSPELAVSQWTHFVQQISDINERYVAPIGP